jgi:cobalamin biosynthesis Mg chelatase CobN
VPPYARAGLYKELTTLRELITEYRESPDANSSLRPVIAAQLSKAGLFDDKPYPGTADGVLTVTAAEQLQKTAKTETSSQQSNSIAAFDEYILELSSYLQVLEQRLFSEGLHSLGQAPNADQTLQYLTAYFSENDAVPYEALQTIAELPLDSSLEQAVSAINKHGGLCGDVTAVTDRVSLLANELTPDKVSKGKTLSDQYEETLYYGEYFRWQLLKIRALCGDKTAKKALDSELAVMTDINTSSLSGTSSSSSSGKSYSDQSDGDTPAYALSKKISEAYGMCYFYNVYHINDACMYCTTCVGNVVIQPLTMS